MVDSKEWDQYIINSNLEAAAITSSNFVSQVQKAFSSIQPQHLNTVTLTGGRNATEHAILDAFKVRGGNTRNLTVLGFTGANHGHGIAMQQFAHPNMSLSLGWPSLNYPTSSGQDS